MELTPPPGAGTPLTTGDVTKLVQEQIERDRKWLEFAQSQGERDRSYFKHLFNRTYWFIAAMVAVVGIGGTILGLRSIQQIRDEAKLTVDAEVGKVQAELQHTKTDVDESAADLKRKVQQQLDSEQGEVRKRIEAEFQTEPITHLVRTVAKERTEQDLNGVIKAEVVSGIQQQAGTIQNAVESETRKAVKEYEPTITSIVRSETEGQINKAVDPVRAQMKSYGDTISFTTLATLAKNGDRKAFDTLNHTDIYATMPNALPLGATIVTDIVRQYENTLRLERQWTGPTKPTPDEMKGFLEHNPDVNFRLTALDNFPEGDHSIVPVLIRVIQNDANLGVVYAAFYILNRETNQKFVFPDYAAVATWWDANKDTWK